MKFLITLLPTFLVITSSFTNPIPEPTLDCIVPLIALGAAAFGVYGGSLGSGFAGQYPYNAGGTYGGPYYPGSPTYAGSPTYPGSPTYLGSPTYPGSPTYGGSNQYYGGNTYYGGSPYDYDYDSFF